jgi:RNA polymerase sigma factor (sigma-70 family)
MDPAPTSPVGDGESAFLANQATVKRAIAFVCRRNHLAGAEAEEFASHVYLKLIENDYAILRKFRGRSKLSTYLAAVINRLFLDYRIKEWGKWRPSMEARRAGPVGILLERLLVRDGLTFDAACEILSVSHQVKAPRTELEQLASRLPVRLRKRFESDDVLRELPSKESSDAGLAERDHQRSAERVTIALQRALEALDAQDRVILMMWFVDGRPAKEIAGALGLNVKPLYGRIERLVERLRSELIASGIAPAEALEMFQSVEIELEWASGNASGGKPEARPSVNPGARK